MRLPVFSALIALSLPSIAAAQVRPTLTEVVCVDTSPPSAASAALLRQLERVDFATCSSNVEGVLDLTIEKRPNGSLSVSKVFAKSFDERAASCLVEALGHGVAASAGCTKHYLTFQFRAPATNPRADRWTLFKQSWDRSYSCNRTEGRFHQVCRISVDGTTFERREFGEGSFTGFYFRTTSLGPSHEVGMFGKCFSVSKHISETASTDLWVSPDLKVHLKPLSSVCGYSRGSQGS